MSKTLPELVSIALTAGEKQLTLAEKRLLLLEPKRKSALQPVFALLKEACRQQKKKKALALIVKKFNAVHEYKRKQAATLLYDSIVASGPCNTAFNEVFRHYGLSRWLMQRRLFTQSLHHIDKAIHIATEYDRWHMALDMVRFRSNIIKKYPSQDLQKKLQMHHEQVKSLNKKINTYEKLSSINEKLLLHYKKHYRVRGAVALRSFNSLIDKCVAIDTKGMGFDIDVMKRMVFSHYSQLTGDKKAAIENELYGYQQWKKNPHRIDDTPWRYSISISNLMQLFNAANNYTHHSELLNELKKAGLKMGKEKIWQQVDLIFLELQWRMNTGDYKRALQLTELTERKWLLFINTIDISKAITIAYNCGITCFVCHEFHKALQWFSKIIAFPRSGLRHATRETTLLLRNIVFFELGMPLPLTREKNILAKTKRYSAAYAFEYELNRTLSNIDKAQPAMQQLNAELEKLLTKLRRFEKRSAFKGIEGLEEVILWLQSRTTGISMQQLLVIKYK